VVWDIDANTFVDTYPAYYLVYNRSTDGGATWARANGVNPEYLDFPSGTTTFTPHASQHETEAGRTQYGSRLRPDITLEITHSVIVPHLAWNEVITGAGDFEYHFDVFHTTYKNSAWGTKTNATNATKSLFNIHSAAPSVRVGKEGHVHVAYLEEGKPDPGTWLWDLAIYQGPIAKGADLYLPVIKKGAQ
jgi:hypothetical protein